jgi:hypothetical protein
MEMQKLTLLENDLQGSSSPMIIIEPVTHIKIDSEKKQHSGVKDNNYVIGSQKHLGTEHEPSDRINLQFHNPSTGEATTTPTPGANNPHISINSTLNKYIIKLIDSNYYLVLMTLCTILALFLNDIQNAFCPTFIDDPFDIIQLILFILFSVEIILTVIAKDDYLGSFFFWLDFISSVSLLEDISWILGKALEGGM